MSNISFPPVDDVPDSSPNSKRLSISSQKGSTPFEVDSTSPSPLPNTFSLANGSQYHSLIYRILSWQNPKSSTIAFFLNVIFIFAARYLNIIRYIFKGLYIIFGLTAAAEIAGKLIFDSGITSQLCPRSYYEIPKDSLQRFLDDFAGFLNFFVIEFQRILYAEKVSVTVAAFGAFYLSYWLIKWLPLWTFALLTTFVAYLGPLIYLSNREFIDYNIEKLSNSVNERASEMKKLAAKQTERASSTVLSYAGGCTLRAQEYMGSTRQKLSSRSSHFPSVPKTDPVAPTLTGPPGVKVTATGNDFLAAAVPTA